MTIFVFGLGIHHADAEKYLSVEEAQKVCFPGADRFEKREIIFTPENVREIKKLAGVKPDEKKINVWFAKKGEFLEGYFLLDRVIGKHDWIDYAVALSPDGTVQQIEILEFRERIGGEIRRPEWRAQFAGKNSSAKLKLFDDVTNITGATLSCRHVTQGVRKCLAIYEIFLKGGEK